MLATDRFLLISSGRTGTGLLYRWLKQLPGLRVISSIAHEPYFSMAQKCRKAEIEVPPAWTIVRNPWDRYVDLYFWDRGFVHRHDGPFKEFLRKTRAGEKGFPPYSTYWNGVGSNEAKYVARCESFDDDVVRILMTLIPDLVTEEFIREKNEEYRREGDALTFEGTPWRLEPPGSYIDYYDDESRDWVAEMDAEIIDRFGYDFLKGPC